MSYFLQQSDADAEESEPILQRNKSNNSPEAKKYPWEENLMAETLMKPGKLTHAVIVSFNDNEIRAVAPSNFTPSQEGKYQQLR